MHDVPSTAPLRREPPSPGPSPVHATPPPPRRPLPNESLLSEPQPLRPDDEAMRQARLTRMKQWATGLLILSTIIFVVTRLLEPSFPWIAIVRATAEAAMIGGLADWFAVTALFKHPMGIPIPHTAIIPSRKDRVGVTLGAFVQKNFLNRDVIVAKLHSLNAAERMARWMVEPENARRIARQIARALAAATNVLRDDDVEEAITNTVVSRVRSTQVAPLLGKFLSVLTADNRHQALLDDAIRLTAKAITENGFICTVRAKACGGAEGIDDCIRAQDRGGPGADDAGSARGSRASAAVALRRRAGRVHRQAAGVARGHPSRRADQGRGAQRRGCAGVQRRHLGRHQGCHHALCRRPRRVQAGGDPARPHGVRRGDPAGSRPDGKGRCVAERRRGRGGGALPE
jgi:hypothetical protein